jgi:hypothetical protein
MLLSRTHPQPFPRGRELEAARINGFCIRKLTKIYFLESSTALPVEETAPIICNIHQSKDNRLFLRQLIVYEIIACYPDHHRCFAAGSGQ